MGSTTIDDYALKAFEFYEKIARVIDPEEIRTLILEALTYFGFEYVTCAKVPSPGENPLEGVLLNTRPDEYVAHYVKNNYAETDPVVTELRRTMRPYSWTDVRSNRSLTKLELAIMDEAREFRVNDGFVVPIVTYMGSVSIFSPCGEKPNLSPRARSAVELIAAAGHQALKRALIEQRRQITHKDRLTPREREVVQMLALGKTDWEIGEILGISSATVVRHVENAKRKTDATRRTMIVIEALRRGEISI